MILLLPFRLANQKILELEKEVQEGGGAVIHQRLADLQGQLCIAQGEKERRVSQLEEQEVSIAENSMYGFRTMNVLLHYFTYITGNYYYSTLWDRTL
jgi:hypothetical protein